MAMLGKFLFRITVSLFLITCSAILGTGYILKKGISIDTFTVAQATVSNFSLQWQDRLTLDIDTITVNIPVSIQQKNNPAKDFSKACRIFGKGIRAAHYIDGLFSRITVKAIRFGDVTAAIHFDLDTGQEPCFIHVNSNDFALQSSLSIEQDNLIFDIAEVVAKQVNSSASGQIRLNVEKEQATGTLSALLAGALPVTLDFKADQNQLSFQGKEAGRISTITPFVELFDLKPDIRLWITDYLKADRYRLKTVTGVVAWNNPQAILDTLYAEAQVDDCVYTFAQGLEPIKSSQTNVVLSRGILTITPYDATFYERDTGNSKLDINFNDSSNILLTVHLNTRIKANRDILTLLDHYNISLPFSQVTGKVAVDLTLTVNLNNEQVTTKANFLVDKGVFEFGGKEYGLKNGKIALEDSDITIEHAEVSFEDMFIAQVSGTLNPVTTTGDLIIRPDQLSLEIGKSILSLDPSANKPTLHYHIREDGDFVDASGSSWMLDAIPLQLGAFNTPFSSKNFSGVLSPTLLAIPPDISSTISGSFSINKKQFHFQSDLSKYKIKDLQLEKPGVPLDIRYDKELTIRAKKTSNWRMHNIPATLYPSEIKYSKNTLAITNGRMSYGDFFDSSISGSYNNLAKQGSFLLEELHLKDKNIGVLLGAPTGIAVEVIGLDERFIIKVPQHELEISADKDRGWSATFNDLAAVHPQSDLLQSYKINAGSLTISSKNGKKPYLFSADIPSRYQILVKDNKPIGRLEITGSVTEQGITATVNKDMRIEYSDQLRITTKDLSFNIPAIISFIREHQKPDTPDSEPENGIVCTVESKNSGLYLTSDSRLLADRIFFKYSDNKSNMTLEHGAGSIIFKMDGEQFFLKGKGLNDTFINELARDGHFENGVMSIAAQGTFDKFTALIQVRDTVLEKFATLNNILAFINTVPALITFSLPDYDSRGLPINSVIVGMKVRETMATVESFTVDSPELKLAGNGRVDLAGKLIEMDFKLTTRARENLKKIPLAGYILAGGDKQSINLKVSGDLRNPDVSNSMVEEVVTLPFGILYRALTLPLHLVESMVDSVSNVSDVSDVSKGEPDASAVRIGNEILLGE